MIITFNIWVILGRNVIFLYSKALGKLGNIVAETLLRKHCFLPMFRHISKSGQTLGNISEKHRETSNVSEFARKHICFPGSKFCFRNNVSTGEQTWKHLRKHRESQMFPQQCFLVCPGLKKSHLDQLSHCDVVSECVHT